MAAPASPPVMHDEGADIGRLTKGLVETASRNLRTLVLVPAFFAAASVGLIWLRGRTYAAESTFTTEAQQNGLQRFAGLAAQFGVPLGAPAGGESVDFYVDLARSRVVLDTVVLRSYRFVRGRWSKEREGTLIDFYELTRRPARDQLLLAEDRLLPSIDVRATPKSNIIRIRTVAGSPDLAEAINRNVLDAISGFNLHRRRSRAMAERAFVEERLAEARRELEREEGSLEAFLERNRRYTDSPQLAGQYGRLMRRVELRQQVFTTLAQAYEQSRIEEVRNTPVITIVDRPEGSARVALKLRTVAVVGFLLGAALAIFAVLARERWARSSAAGWRGAAAPSP